jgi:hypothetical protein
MSLPQGAQASTRIIRNFGLMKPLGLPTVNAFATRYSKEYCYVAPVHPAVEYPTHALHSMYVKRWQARQEPFWWNVIARKDIDNHRTVRTWAARRLRHAFVESLRKKGYAPDGNRIDGNGQPLIGTAQLFPHQTIMRRNFLDLVWQTDLAVDAILKRRNTYKPSYTGGQGQERRPLYWKKKAVRAPETPETPYQYPIERRLKL